MKAKRIILFGLTLLFLTSTALVWASTYDEDADTFEETLEAVEQDSEIENISEDYIDEKNSLREAENIVEKTIEENTKNHTQEKIGTGAANIMAESNAAAKKLLISTPSISEKNTEKVFDIEDTILIKYNGKEERVIVPDGVEIIGEAAFRGNPYVKELILPDSVKCAKSEAFAYMENLEMIEKGAFFYTDYDDIYDGSDKLSQFNVRSDFY